ncbi:antitoxin protein of toxin-antitoxin system [Motilibacter peucedani]|uniref:Antitoxin protein of toxin-antitoxin system n=1 Tax=Motilibacter peucedani TaxID=598650 RepID=A0A420XNC7_9ACTN|nr:Rv0909 family putative TA system antitoxin [Motilibacter peucedani]RKS72773.1 antitoxin protein of toxin-antitoxin system [Motilibacter peucedani]
MGIEDSIEKASDAGIEKAGDAAEAKTGGKGEQQIESAEKAADAKIGE